MVEIIDPNNNELWVYHLDKRLKRFLDRQVMEKIKKKDKDYVMLIDGYDGSGKSTFAQQVGRYVDPSLSLDRICMTADEFKKAIINASKGQTVIYDEAVTGMSAGDSVTRVGRILKSMMMQMRQKNLFVIVILPIIFEFNKYAVLSRAKSFFHIYEKNGNMGYWVGFNRKDTRNIYLKGKKTHAYTVRSRFMGRFYGKYAVNEEEYRKKKADALFELDDDKESVYDTKYRHQRDRLIMLIKKETNKSLREMESLFKTCGVDLSYVQIGNILTENKGNNELLDVKR